MTYLKFKRNKNKEKFDLKALLYKRCNNERISIFVPSYVSNTAQQFVVNDAINSTRDGILSIAADETQIYNVAQLHHLPLPPWYSLLRRDSSAPPSAPTSSTVCPRKTESDVLLSSIPII